MGEAELQEVKEGVFAVALDAQVELVGGVQNELVRTCLLALDDAGQHVNTQLLSQIYRRTAYKSEYALRFFLKRKTLLVVSIRTRSFLRFQRFIFWTLSLNSSGSNN
jgi:hypothetical protein